MLAINITHHAGQQLQEIFDYTNQHWGKSQAKDYLLRLQKSMQLLAYNPNIAMRYEDNQFVYYFPSQSHVIYFLKENQKLIVISVLHKNCLPQNDPILDYCD